VVNQCIFLRRTQAALPHHHVLAKPDVNDQVFALLILRWFRSGCRAKPNNIIPRKPSCLKVALQSSGSRTTNFEVPLARRFRGRGFAIVVNVDREGYCPCNAHHLDMIPVTKRKLLASLSLLLSLVFFRPIRGQNDFSNSSVNDPSALKQ